MSKEYTIELVERWTFLNAQRNPTDGYRVTFRVSKLGITDHIILSETAYTPENIAKAISNKIEIHNLVMGI